MSYVQKSYKFLRKATILSKAECRRIAIKAAADYAASQNKA